MKLQIGIIGGEEKSLEKNKEKSFILNTAYELGKILGKKDCILVTGGQSGVMEYSSKGVYENKGLVLSTPGPKRNSSNKYVNVEVCTPINVGDYLFAGILSSDLIFVLPGGFGTLAEIYLACRYEKKLIFIESISDNLIEKCFNSFDLEYKNIEILKLDKVSEYLDLIKDKI